MVVANKDKIRILSIDGGELRGLIAARTLQWIETISGHKIHELFDIIVGTSTGGLIAAGLTATDKDGNRLMTTEDLITLYTERATTIFPNKFYARLSNIIEPAYSSNGLKKELELWLGESTLSNCKPDIQVAAYDIANDETVFFKSRYANELEKSRSESKVNAKLIDICCATSAAPTYFKPHKFEYQTDKPGSEPYDIACIDGGVFVNNPSLAAIVEVRNHADYYCGSSYQIPLENFYCLSVGTGEITSRLGYLTTRFWGQLKWAKPAIDIMMKGVNQTTDYQVRQLLPTSNYVRLNPSLDRKYGKLDDTSIAARDAWIGLVRDEIEEGEGVRESVEDLLQHLRP